MDAREFQDALNIGLAGALTDILTSPNEHDANSEEANVVDGLFAIARSIDGLSNAIRGQYDLRERVRK